MTDQHAPRMPYPSWCGQEQCQESNPGDGYHQRMAVAPGVFRKTHGTAVATDLVVVTFTSRTVREEVWVGLDLGEGSEKITLSDESAVRLRRQSAQMLHARDGGDLPMSARFQREGMADSSLHHP